MSKFYRGKKSLFNATTHKNGLYFATDVNELYLSLGEGNVRVYGSEYLIKNVDLDETGTTLLIDYRDEAQTQKSINLVELMAKATQASAGLMSNEDKINLDTLAAAYKNDELGKVQGVADGDKVLSMSDKLISATISLSYDEDTKEIKLLGKDNAELGSVDATPFIKDGMLQDVEIVTDETDGKKYIEFTWNVTVETEVEGEKVETTKKDRIAVEDLVVSYTAGNGILISESYEVSIKLAEASENNPNFLELDETGLKMSGITTDATVLQKDIVVAGLNGTLGTGNYANGTTIPAGTSIYEILTKILSQEIYPSNAKVSNTGNLTSKYSAPSFTLTNSGATVEVGTAATVSGVNGYDPTATPTSRQYSGFTNGYSAADDDKADSTGNPPSVSVTGTTLLDGTFTLTRTYSGFGLTGAALTTSSSSESASTECTIAEDSTLVVKEGANSVTYKMEGPGHSGKIVESPAYYIVSNLGNTDSAKVVAKVSEKTFSNTTATAGSNTLTVTGAFKYYIGYVDTVPTDIAVEGDTTNHATTAIKAMNNLAPNWCSASGNTISTGGTLPAGKNMCIAVPSHYVLSSIMNGFDLESKDSFTSSTVKYKLADGTFQDYTIYSMNSAADWKFKTIIINKA